MLLLLLFFPLLSFTTATNVLIETSKGKVLGYTERTSDGQTARVFKSLPFAAPPIGPLRFALPQPANQWEGVKDARQYSAACYSKSMFTSSSQETVSEDCLYINLFIGERCTPASPCPVMVYFHPGNNNFDSAVMFNDSHILHKIASQGVIFALPAFRLGIFGLLTFSQRTAPRNLAFYDMIAGLRWIQDEISLFGGDKDSVTILGTSNGATDALVLSLSHDLSIPGQPWIGRQLFHRVASMSGPLESCSIDLQTSMTLQAAYRANCTSSLLSSASLPEERLILACLRTLTSSQLADIAYRMDIKEGYSVFRGMVHDAPLFQDADIKPHLRDPPPYDLLLGAVAREWPLGSGATTLVTGKGETGELLAVKHVPEFMDKINKDAWRFNAPFISQLTFAGNYIIGSAMRQRHPERNIFLYQLDTEQYNIHADDIYYLLGTHSHVMNEEDSLVMDMYAKMFTDFAKHGTPGKDVNQFDPSKGNYYSIHFNTTAGVKPHMKEGYHYNIVNYWLDELVEFDLNISLSKKLNVDEDYPIVNEMPWLYATPEGIDLSSTSELIPGSPKSNALIYVIIFTVVVVVFIIVGCIWCRKSRYERIR